MKSLRCLVLTTTVIYTSFSLSYAADNNPYENNLLGNWGGLRDKMADNGIDATLEYKADVWDVTSGGKKQGSNYNDNLDILFSFDNEKMLGIEGNNSVIHFINNSGGKPNEHRVNSVQGIDNIEVGTNAFKLYEAWDEQAFFDNKLAILMGVHDLNSEFDVTDMSANFIKPTMQIGQAFAQSGENGPSVFPTTSLAARIKIMPTNNSYISVAAFDGIPGDVNKPKGSYYDFGSKDGALLISEVGITPNKPEGADSELNKFALGGWMYTTKMDDLVDVDGSGNPIKRRMAGAYLLSSYQLYTNEESGNDIGAFFRAGLADGNTAQVEWDYETGLVGHGLIPTRSDSEIGLGISQSHNGDKYIQSVSAANKNEYSYELYYNDKITNGINIQPDIQYVVNPGTDKETENATVFGVRFDINF